ncbi:MAG: dihydrolipoamide acetyltransferase family protein [Bacillota bacterium]
MVTKVIMPKLGLTMSEGTLVKWLKREGDRVTRGEGLMEVTTDKVTTEVESPGDGVLRKIVVPEGTTVACGAVIGIIADEAEDISSVLAELGLGPTAGAVEQGTPTTVREVKASPAVRRLAKELGVDLSTVIGTGPDGRITEGDVKAAAAATASALSGERLAESQRVSATPLAKSIAEKEAVDLGTVTGTGPAGRIMAQDILAYKKQEKGLPESQPSEEKPTVVPVQGIRAIIAERMSKSARETARVTLVSEVRVDRLKTLKDAISTRLMEKKGVKVTYTDLIVWAAAHALRNHPNCNASWVGDHLEIKPCVNIGVAVDIDDGLVVPVIRDADKKSISEIAEIRERLVGSARSGRLSPSDLEGGTFTVTNLGTYGVDFFTPIINLPESLILGVGRIMERPIVEDGRVVPGLTVYLSLVFDHRVVDGAPAARLLQEISSILEDPMTALV